MNQSMLSLVFCALATGAFAKKPVVTIPLDKQHVPVMGANGRIVMNKTAYFGTLSVGAPNTQTFTVVFDTGSGHLMLPSLNCHSDTCLQHKQFDPARSHAMLKPDRVEIMYGTGEVTGDTMRERMCLGHNTAAVAGGAEKNENQELCISLDMVLATEMTDQPFSAFEFDGVLGLGLQSLAVSPSYSFLGQIAASMPQSEVPRIFGVFISDHDAVSSEISFGGYDETRMSSPLQWTPVNRPELGYWQVRIKSVSVDDAPFSICDDGTCIAILDSGTSSIGVPKVVMHDMHYKLARPISLEMDDALAEKTDCRNVAGPRLAFHLEDGMTISLDAYDYSRPAPFHARADLLASQADFAKSAAKSGGGENQSTYCRATFLPVTMEDPMPVKTFILGEPALRKYYTAYDWGEERVGFSLALPPLSI